jgi:Flp pilus assembly secretin CpaC
MPRGCSVGLLLVLLLSACGATTSGTSDDLTITTRVKIALLNDARVGGLRLDVKTFQRAVTLSGTVKTPADEQAAIAVARRVDGVRRVMSELKIQEPFHQSSVRMRAGERPIAVSAAGTSLTIADGPQT